MTEQLSPTTHVSECESNSALCLLIVTEAWATIIQTMFRGLTWLFLITLGWLCPIDGPNHQYLHGSVWFCFSFYQGLGYFYYQLWFFICKLALIASVICFCFKCGHSSFYSSAAFWGFLVLISLVFFWSSYRYWSCTIDIESYSSVEYFFNSIFPLKVSWVVMVFCHMAGLFWLTKATFTLGVGALLLIYWLRNVTTLLKSFHTCLGVPLLRQLPWTTCHTCCHSTGIKLSILDWGLGIHNP